MFSCMVLNKPSFSIILRIELFPPYTHKRIFVTLVSEVGQLCMVNARSQTKIAEHADLVALLADMKKSIEQGQEEIKKGQEEMKKELEKGQGEMKNLI
ncbi:hypothetical protein AVEN_32499-1 [Araneus ventricosus]|uniref:Uncharacterized protein n=1 Tax=Araneus ventricosus TaxID=182803 RepID=A0A4Y2AE48_ARAVE|nr:hypothetical protein AVEN_139782-1 [Araneus ventricosus]GBL77843.1 hypothetical protein AVEN_249035-1 [Araneus ventricosus]GBL77864.1 hypothetical protein AVEN_24303-1 [Araneus ventricosus]GBL77877.1 hypothetical protein AVEN_32499-1 [Araneus ventricosus]